MPFGDLFARAAAVVHHGGIGTTAQALAAGVPQLFMPMGFDQPDNAARSVRLGVAQAIPPPQWNAVHVATALTHLLSSTAVAAACRRWRGAIDAGAALARTCDLIEQQYRTPIR